MTGKDQTEIRMRLVIDNPVPGVAHGLQDKNSHPVDTKTSKDGKPLTFDFAIRIGPGPKFYGEHVRSEGPERRFVYIAIGEQAGQKGSCWSRRMKIDIHQITQALLDKAVKGKVLEATLNGTGKDGTPSCATVSPTQPWRAV
ncbi:MAG: DUF5990 family protein [Hyphomonadaceae bacterium]|nr:DUF5990 family protein [Hyphomonadaceae bacterium]